MAEVSSSTKLARSADEVWKQISNFADVSWIDPSLAVTCTGIEVGAERTLTLEAGPLVERLEKLDQDTRSLSYSILEGPMPVTDYLGTLSVVPEASGCTLTWKARFDAPAEALGEMTKALQGMLDGTLAKLE